MSGTKQWSYLGIPYVTDEVPDEIMPVLPNDPTGNGNSWPGYDPCAIPVPAFVDGPTQYYIDTENGNDGTAGNSGRGSVAFPRQTIPNLSGTSWVLAEGTQIFITANSTFMPGVEPTVTVNGSATNPCWIVGVGGRPTYAGGVTRLRGTHLLIDNIVFDNMGSSRILVGEVAKDYTFDYLTIRYCEFIGNGVLSTYNSSAIQGEQANWVMIYRIKMHGFGQWDYAGMTNFDRHGIQPQKSTKYWWIIENEIYHMQGDSVQLNTSGHGNGIYAQRPHYTYIAGNDFHHNYENAVDNKNSYHTIVSQNLIHGYGNIYKEANNTALLLANDGEGWLSGYEWGIFNTIYDCSLGVKMAGTAASVIDDQIAPTAQLAGQKTFLVGNLMYDVDAGVLIDSRGDTPNFCPIFVFADENWLVDNTIVVNDGSGKCITQGRLLTGSSGPIIYNLSGHILWAPNTASNDGDLNVKTGGSNTIRTGTRNLIFDIDRLPLPAWIPTHKFQVYSDNSTADPQFSDFANGDYTLASSSPAIGMGVESPVYALFESLYGIDIRFDHAGNPRLTGPERSIGAYESGTPPAPAPPVFVTPPSVTGTAETGETLTALRGSVTASPTPSYVYQWLRCDAAGANPVNVGSGGSTYALTSADVGSTIRVKITATNSEGTANATSSQTSVITPAAGAVGTIFDALHHITFPA